MALAQKLGPRPVLHLPHGPVETLLGWPRVAGRGQALSPSLHNPSVSPAAAVQEEMGPKGQE